MRHVTQSRAGQALWKTSMKLDREGVADIPEGKPQTQCRHQSSPNTSMGFSPFVKLPTGILFVGGGREDSIK